jgi:hypothetical protein
MPHQENNLFEHDRADIDYREEAKRQAHLMNICMWQQQSKRLTFNSKEQYWTLMDDRSFELETLKTHNLISSPSQFHGVNDNERKYKACMEQFFGIQGYYGEWTTILRQNDICPHGGIVYLDTMSQLDEYSAIASTMLAATLEACGSQTLICANFCMTNPRQGQRVIESHIFSKRLLEASEKIQNKWALVMSPEGHDCYLPEKTSSTQMVTYFFWRA